VRTRAKREVSPIDSPPKPKVDVQEAIANAKVNCTPYDWPLHIRVDANARHILHRQIVAVIGIVHQIGWAGHVGILDDDGGGGNSNGRRIWIRALPVLRLGDSLGDGDRAAPLDVGERAGHGRGRSLPLVGGRNGNVTGSEPGASELGQRPSGIGPKPSHQAFRAAPPIHDQRASIPLQKTKRRRMRSSDLSNHNLGQGIHAHCALQPEKSL
jgi:hypothetical protein